MVASTPAAASGNRRRKTHNKSRNGCSQCKKRHYKVRSLPQAFRLKFRLSRKCWADIFISSFAYFASSAMKVSSPTLSHDNWKNANTFLSPLHEVYPICSNCKRLGSSCSLSNPASPTDSEVVEKQLNLDDLQLLHDWGTGNDTKFSDHQAEELFRQQRGREIELGFQHPYGMYSG